MDHTQNQMIITINIDYDPSSKTISTKIVNHKAGIIKILRKTTINWDSFKYA